MVNLELSKVLPSRSYIYLAGFLPGLFFEISILLGNPELVSRLGQNLQRGFTIGHYTTLCIAVFLGFVIGTGFMGLMALIQFLFSYAYQFLNFLWRQVCKRVLHPLSAWLLRNPRWRCPWLILFNRYAVMKGFIGSQEWKAVQGCWQSLAKGLLKTRYGVDPNDFESDEWKPLYWTLGSPTFEEMRGNILMIASHAVGWSGLAATRLAPALSNRYYLSFCLFMIVNGLIHDFYVTVRHYDPRIAGYLNIRAVLREFPKSAGNRAQSEDRESEDDRS